jgi:hypothetical protein
MGLLVIVSAFIAAGCGELDTILSSNLSANSVYRVNATVEGRDLDECAIVGIDSRIRPYFLDSIEGDPDVTGLVVFLETPKGELASRKVRYVPGSPEQSSGQSIGTDRDPDGQILGDDTPETPAGQMESGESVFEEIESGVDAENLDAESGEGEKDEIPPVNDGLPDGNSSQEKEGADVERFSDSDDVWEGEAVYQIRGKRSFSGIEETADTDELVVYVSKLSRELPALLLPEKLAIGSYILVFQVLGLQGVLSHSEKFIYYISDAELTLGDIQTYHSGSAERSGIVSPGSVLMLETRVSADDRLEPYIVWYHGKNRLKEGPVSEGVDRLLWQTPVQTGFQALRAEIFPFTPTAAYKTTTGLVKQLSLVISSKQARRAVGNTETPQPDSLIRWYQLGGNLSDSLAAQDGGRELKPGDDTVITWLPKTGIYGLAAGSDHTYTISGPLFTPDKDLPGRGQFVFRFTAQSSGIIFSGIFALDRASQTLKLDLSCDTDTNRLTLSCALGDEKQNQTLFLPFSVRDEWITVAVDFIAENKGFRTELSLLSTGNGEIQADLASVSDKSAPAGKNIVLPGALTGEGVFRIGAVAVSANSSTDRASDFAGSAVEEVSANGAAVSFTTAKSGANTAAAQMAGDMSASLLTGEENGNTASLTNTAAVVTPVLDNVKTGKISGTGAPALILDAIAILFAVSDSGTADTGEPVDEEDAVESASENAAPPGDVFPEQSGVPAKLSVERSASGFGTEQPRRSPLSAKAGTEKDTDRDSAEEASPWTPGSDEGGKISENPAAEETAPTTTGEETELTEKTEDDDQIPDAHTAEVL